MSRGEDALVVCDCDCLEIVTRISSGMKVAYWRRGGVFGREG